MVGVKGGVREWNSLPVDYYTYVFQSRNARSHVCARHNCRSPNLSHTLVWESFCSVIGRSNPSPTPSIYCIDHEEEPSSYLLYSRCNAVIGWCVSLGWREDYFEIITFIHCIDHTPDGIIKRIMGPSMRYHDIIWIATGKVSNCNTQFHFCLYFTIGILGASSNTNLCLQERFKKRMQQVERRRYIGPYSQRYIWWFDDDEGCSCKTHDFWAHLKRSKTQCYYRRANGVRLQRMWKQSRTCWLLCCLPSCSVIDSHCKWDCFGWKVSFKMKNIWKKFMSNFMSQCDFFELGCHFPPSVYAFCVWTDVGKQMWKDIKNGLSMSSTFRHFSVTLDWLALILPLARWCSMHGGCWNL